MKYLIPLLILLVFACSSEIDEPKETVEKQDTITIVEPQDTIVPNDTVDKFVYNPEDHFNIEVKEFQIAHIIQYNLHSDYLDPECDEIGKKDYGYFHVDYCLGEPLFSCDSSEYHKMVNFVKWDMENPEMLLLVQQWYTPYQTGYDLIESFFPGNSQFQIFNLPFEAKISRYQYADSSKFILHSKEDDDAITFTFNDSTITLGLGEVFKVVEEIRYQYDSTYCIMNLFLIHKITNYGIDTLPHKDHLNYFMF